ncbi:MAG: translation elongation factor Ts [Candidatus Omnitrophica bacterium]|nr:translation elongation factor Ts [Candidatus Omnitrophota bacterium]
MKDAIKQLREKTGAGMMDCKAALKEASGDAQKAVDILRKKGLAAAQKKSSRVTKQGVVQSYIHMGGKIGVLVEINCETDFVAKNDEFISFVKDIAMQVAAANPLFVKKEEIPETLISKEKDILKSQASGSEKKKPANVIEKIIAGKLEKFYEEICLLEQPFIRDPKIKIRELLTSVVAKTGENVVIRRFTRYQLGEEETAKV